MSASLSSDPEDALAVKRPAGLTSLQWQLIEGICLLDPSKRVNLIYVDEVLREFAESNSALVNPAAENASSDLRKQYRLELGFSFGGFLRHLEEKCRLQCYLHGHPGHVLRRLQDVLDEMVASKASYRATHVKLVEQALLSFDFFLRNVVEGDSVRPHARSQKTSLKNGVLHRMVNKLLGLGPMAADWKVKSAHRIWVEKYGSTQKENSASEAITVDLGIHANQPWFISLYHVTYDPKNPVGYGFFVKIFKGTWLRTPVVIKVLGYGEDREIVSTELFMHKLQVWYPRNHPHVIKLFGACHVDKCYFVREYAPHGTLDQFVRRVENANQKWRKLYEIALGLQCLHGLNIVHNDLKCDNFLIGVDGKAKISDFGLSCILNCAKVQINPRVQGAVHWKSLEYLRGDRVTLASGIYSFGMCILEVVTKETQWGARGAGGIRPALDS